MTRNKRIYIYTRIYIRIFFIWGWYGMFIQLDRLSIYKKKESRKNAEQ